MSRIDELHSDSRETFVEMTQCDPRAGALVRCYLDHSAIDGTPIARATMELMAWLILTREAIGSDSAGRA